MAYMRFRRRGIDMRKTDAIVVMLVIAGCGKTVTRGPARDSGDVRDGFVARDTRRADTSRDKDLVRDEADVFEVKADTDTDTFDSSWDPGMVDAGSDETWDAGPACDATIAPEVYENSLCSEKGSVEIAADGKMYHYCTVALETGLSSVNEAQSLSACHADVNVTPDPNNPRQWLDEKVPFRPAMKVKDMWTDKGGKLWIQVIWLNGRLTYPKDMAIEVTAGGVSYADEASNYVDPYNDLTKHTRISGVIPQLLPSGIITYKVDPDTLKASFQGENVFRPQTMALILRECLWWPDWPEKASCSDFPQLFDNNVAHEVENCDVCSYPHDGIVVGKKRFLFLPSGCALFHGRALMVEYLDQTEENKLNQYNLGFDVSVKDRTLNAIRVKDANAPPFDPEQSTVLHLPIDVRLLDYRNQISSGAACNRCMKPIAQVPGKKDRSIEALYSIFSFPVHGFPFRNWFTNTPAYMDPWQHAVWNGLYQYHIENSLTFHLTGTYTDPAQECTQLPRDYCSHSPLSDYSTSTIRMPDSHQDIAHPYKDCMWKDMKFQPTAKWFSKCGKWYYPYVLNSCNTTLVQVKPGKPGLLSGWTFYDQSPPVSDTPSPYPWLYLFYQPLWQAALPKGTPSLHPACMSAVHNKCGPNPCGGDFGQCIRGCDGQACVDRTMGTMKWWMDLKDVFIKPGMMAGDQIVLPGMQGLHIVDTNMKTERKIPIRVYRLISPDSLPPDADKTNTGYTNRMRFELGKYKDKWRIFYEFLYHGEQDKPYGGFYIPSIAFMDLDGSSPGYFYPGGDIPKDTYLTGVMDDQGGPYVINEVLSGPSSLESPFILLDADIHENRRIAVKKEDISNTFYGFPQCMGSDHGLYSAGIHKFVRLTADLTGYKSIPLDFTCEDLACGDDATAYCNAYDGHVYAISMAKGVLWSFDTHDIRLTEPLIGHDGRILVATQKGLVIALSKDGHEQWHTQLDNKVYMPGMTLSEDGTIYVGDIAGTLYAINEKNGQIKWRFHTIAPIISTPVIGPDGTVYVVDGLGFFYAVSGSSPLADTPWSTFRHDQQHTGRFGAPLYP